MNRILIKLQLLACFFLCNLHAASRPNIILMMADDMGWSDIGCYGSEINTPNLNNLAENGVRFTQFYNTGRCCPTRASLLTGTYPHQAGIGWMMQDQKLPGYKGDLGKNVRTIAEVLKTAGYATYMAGKWHVTPHVRPGTPKYNWPRQRGFDRFYGTIHGAGSFFDPNSLTRENELISPLTDTEYKPEEFYYTHAINDHGVRYIREHKDPGKPFFMYLAHTAPHWPMHALPKDIKKYKGKYDKGWDEIRKARYDKQIQLGLIQKEWKLSPRDSRAPAWEDAPNKEWDINNMEVYAAMIDALDQGVGRIVKALKDTNQFENTLFLFIADNGGCAEGMGRRNGIQFKDKEPESIKPMGKDELQLDMIPKRTRDGRVVKQGTEVMAGGPDTYHGYGLAWANASNTPFREYKHWVHEGGISSPLVAHWPSGINPERHGKLESQPGHLIDIMATCVDLSGAQYPSSENGNDVVPMQGTSLAPAFNGHCVGRKTPIFWEHEGNRAMRDGKWKLVAKGPASPWELYDIEADRTELNDLAESHPEKLHSMATAWENWALEAHAKPWPWEKKNKKNTKN
jgi:arylsulfatase A-like enzyme